MMSYIVKQKMVTFLHIYEDNTIALIYNYIKCAWKNGL